MLEKEWEKWLWKNGYGFPTFRAQAIGREKFTKNMKENEEIVDRKWESDYDYLYIYGK